MTNDLVITIKHIIPCGKGEEAKIQIELKNNQNSDIQNFHVSAAMLFELAIHENSVISTEIFSDIEYKSQLFTVIKKGIDIISYGDNTKRQLITKLRQKGFDRYIAEDAACYLSEHGLIRESEHIKRAMIFYAEKKLFGKNRIYAELIKKGFESHLIKENLENELNTIDFIENCAKIIDKRGGIEMINDCTDYAEKQKVFSIFMRYGYTSQEIKSAINLLQEIGYDNEK